MFSNYTTYYWIIGWGVVSIVSGLTEAFWPAFVAAIFSGFGVYKLLRHGWLKAHPISRVMLWLTSKEPSFKDQPYVPQKGENFRNIVKSVGSPHFIYKYGVRNIGEIACRTTGNYWVCIELKPRLSFVISHLNLQFIGNNHKPEVTALYDQNAYIPDTPSFKSDNNKGMSLYYDKGANINKGDAIYFIALLEAKEQWMGNLRLALYIRDDERRDTNIPFKFTQ